MHSSDLRAALQGFYRRGKLRDATIRCIGREWKVHRVMLACHGRFFERWWQNNFVESHTGILNLADDEPDAVDRLIGYAYHLDYDDNALRSNRYGNPLEINAAVYALADKYECRDLGVYAAQKFARAAIQAHSLYKPPFVAIEMVYNTTPSSDRTLRDICVKMWAALRDTIQQSKRAENACQLFEIDAVDFGRDTFFLAPMSSAFFGKLFRDTLKEHLHVRSMIEGEYPRGTPYNEIASVLGLTVTAVAIVLKRVLEGVCRTVRDMGQGTEGLMQEFAMALHPDPSQRPPSSPNHRRRDDRDLDDALRARCELQVKLVWQHGAVDAKWAGQQTFASLFTNHELCYAVFLAARTWAKTKIDKQIDQPWSDAMSRVRRGHGLLPPSRPNPHPQQPDLDAAESPERRRLRDIYRTQWRAESHAAMMNEASQTGHAVCNSYETFHAERLPISLNNPTTGRLELPVVRPTRNVIDTDPTQQAGTN